MNELNLTIPQLLAFIAIMLPLVVYLWIDLLIIKSEDRAVLYELLEALEREV